MVALLQAVEGRTFDTAPDAASLTLATQPTAGNLLTMQVGFDKSVGSVAGITPGWVTLGDLYQGASVSQVTLYRIADGTTTDLTCEFTYTPVSGGGGSAYSLTEWDAQVSALAQVDVQPNPPDDVTTTPISGDAGAAAGAEFALAFAAMDSQTSWGPTWTGGFIAEHDVVGVNDNGRACIAVAAKVLAATDTTSTTFDVTAADQTALRIARFTTGAPPAFGAPTDLTAAAVSTTQIDLDWTPVLNATGYDVEQDAVIVATSVPPPPYSVTGLTASTGYGFRVRAVQ